MSSTFTSRSNSTEQDRSLAGRSQAPSTTTSSTSSSRDPSSSRAPAQPQRPAIDPLRQTFPKPTDDIDMEQAMNSHPGRWSFKGQVKQQQEREEEQERRAAAHKAAGKQREDMEAAKKDLMKSFAELSR